MRKLLLAGWLLLGLFSLICGRALAREPAALPPAVELLTRAPLPLARYQALAVETETLVASLSGRPREEITGRLQQRIQRWKAFQAVVLEDGRQVPIENSYIVALLDSDPPQLEKLTYQLRGVQGRLLGGSGASGRQAGCTGSDCTAALTAILAGREFQWSEDQPNPIQEWIREHVQKFLDWLNQFINRLQIPYLEYILIGIGALALVLAAVYIVRSLTGATVRDARLGDEPVGGEEDLTAETALKKAQELSQGGDYRSAVRYLYLSSLLLMEERGLLRYDRSKTNREYLRSVAGRPEILTSLREVVEVFDRVWYGYQPLEDADYQRYEANVAELRRQK